MTGVEETELCRALRRGGWTIVSIAEHLERSEDFVRVRVRDLPRVSKFAPETSRGGWPEITTTADRALMGRRFEDATVPAEPRAHYRTEERRSMCGNSSAMCIE